MAVMYGKTKRFKLNEEFQTSKGPIKFLRYIETEENQPKVEYIYLNTGETEIDYYGIVYYKVLKYHKKLGIPQPESVKYKYHIDTNRDLKFGVELELTVKSARELRLKLAENGISVKNPNSTHEVCNDGWKIVYDGSIRAARGYEGCELVSPPSTDFKELEIVCKVLSEIGAKTNVSCGLHVHHEIKDLKRQQIIRIYEFYNKYEKLIDLMHSKNRENNKYCKPISYIIDKVRQCDTREKLLNDIAGRLHRGYYSSCRYYKINLRSYLHYKTIEFRQSDASIKFEDIKSWVMFTHKIVERGTKINCDIEPFETPDEFEYLVDPTSKYENMMKELGIYWLTDEYKMYDKKVNKNKVQATA